MGGIPGVAIGGGLKNKNKTHCPSGHEFTEENTRWVKKNTSRICKICARVAYKKNNDKTKKLKEEMKALEAKLNSSASRNQ